MLSRTAARYAPLRDQRTTAAALLVPSYRYRIHSAPPRPRSYYLKYYRYRIRNG